ncbi:phosphoribosyltransferase [Dethiobacter alkaliphilus]|uniref:Phosphoribosyltransferase n=1 Tax=Dethiobacter alkaliphilus AHT 1 TaxID=555088 RepID=C0GF71_DETAL|nr:phosphoribosyltransferase [Dethiobacter alkaliphilus]EEG77831.1 phosphoribosyltransferase [Dethiobacter alkaliphilus AHT 1]
MITRYRNRREAGEILARELEGYKNYDTVIYAVPRGGVPVALPVADALDSQLDLIIPRKIPAPHQPEVAIGAVCEDGEVLLDPYLVQRLGISDEYINEAAAREVSEIKRRLQAYRGKRPVTDLSGRTAMVIDDGVATGFTITAALQSISRRGPRELVLAVPVAPPDTVETLSQEVDRIYCPLQPENFYAVGQFYDDFNQLTDDEISRMLQKRETQYPGRT